MTTANSNLRARTVELSDAVVGTYFVATEDDLHWNIRLMDAGTQTLNRIPGYLRSEGVQYLVRELMKVPRLIPFDQAQQLVRRASRL